MIKSNNGNARTYYNPHVQNGTTTRIIATRSVVELGLQPALIIYYIIPGVPFHSAPGYIELRLQRALII